MKGLIFDLGGVVIEWSNAVTYRYIEERYGIPADEFKGEAEKRMPRVQTGEEPEEDWMISTFKHFGNPTKGSEEVWGLTFEAARFNEQVLKIIENIRKKGYRVAALSNLEPSRVLWLKRHGIDTFFDAVIFSCEVGMRKPDLTPGTSDDLAVYKLALSRLGLEAGECIFVDDNVNCVAGAELAGIKSILFKDETKLREELHKIGVL
jgi:HAD superfamily hydrolase (TIGR01509 family)